MNRRCFCWTAIAAATCTHHALSQSPDSDAHALWSLLIPLLQPLPGRGYLIQQSTALPRGFPTLASGTPKPVMQKLQDAIQHPDSSFETFVPASRQTAFSEALTDAQQRSTERAYIPKDLKLPRPYRLLTPAQADEYSGLTPHVVAPGWKQNERAERFFRGWDELSSISLPYYSKDKSLALVWAATSSGCSDWGWWFFLRSNQGWTQQNWKTERRSVCA